jgi:hypothetical protein
MLGRISPLVAAAGILVSACASTSDRGATDVSSQEIETIRNAVAVSDLQCHGIPIRSFRICPGSVAGSLPKCVDAFLTKQEDPSALYFRVMLRPTPPVVQSIALRLVGGTGREYSLDTGVFGPSSIVPDAEIEFTHGCPLE